jgi:pimeloyl-ACP methyl ester carboxylesterase
MRLHIRRLTAAFLCLLVPLAAFSEDKFFESNGVRIRYVDHGRGPAIVLIHGQGDSLDNWVDSGLLSNLAADYRVIALDVRGHGKSGKPHDPKAYGPEMGLDAVRLLDHLGIKRSHFIGYSMGAHLVAQLLTTHSDRFMTATLGGAAGRFRFTAENAASDEQEASERERECVSRSQIYRLAPVNAPKPDEAAIRTLSDACMGNANQDRFALAAVVRTKKDQVVTREQMASIKVPLLGIVGNRDAYLRDFRELQQLRPDMKLVVIEGATHGGSAGAARRPEFVAAVREFLAAN